MIIWSEDLEFNSKLSEYELDRQITKIVDPISLKQFENANLILNILIPIIVFLLSKGNLLYCGISFVLYDLFCLFLSNYCFNKLPYKRYIKLDVKGRQLLLEEINKEKDRVSDKLKKLRERKNCSHCYHQAYGTCIRCSNIRKLCNELEFYSFFSDRYKDIVSEDLKNLKTIELENNTKKSVEFENKLEFLRSAQERISYFDDKYTIVNMKKVSNSLTDLIKILEEKPIGFQLMRTTIMTYIDELLSILEKWQSLDTELQNRYIKDIEKISEELGKNISAMFERIQNMEVQDIDVSISVLLNELNLQNDKEGADDV